MHLVLFSACIDYNRVLPAVYLFINSFYYVMKTVAKIKPALAGFNRCFATYFVEAALTPASVVVLTFGVIATDTH